MYRKDVRILAVQSMARVSVLSCTSAVLALLQYFHLSLKSPSIHDLVIPCSLSPSQPPGITGSFLLLLWCVAAPRPCWCSENTVQLAQAGSGSPLVVGGNGCPQKREKLSSSSSCESSPFILWVLLLHGFYPVASLLLHLFALICFLGST